MTVNLKEEIDRNIADMIARHSPAKAAPPAPESGPVSNDAPAQQPEAVAARQTQSRCFFGRLWKAIFGK